MLKMMELKKTTTSPYHPQSNAQVEVCNKTMTKYLKTQESNTLDWELYMAPMAFAYNPSFHRIIKQLPLNSPLAKMREQWISKATRSITDSKKVLICFKRYKKVMKTLDRLQGSIQRNVKDHIKKAFPRTFKVGDMVLLKGKDFSHKNKKLAETYKGSVKQHS